MCILYYLFYIIYIIVWERGPVCLHKCQEGGESAEVSRGDSLYPLFHGLKKNDL